MKNSNTLIALSKKYLKAFEEKKIDVLKSMFSDDVSLIDWENNINGIDNVVSFNKGVFEQHKSISVQIKSIHCLPSDNTTICDISIKLLKEEESELSVVDTLIFDADGLIKQIKAEKTDKND